MIASIDLSGNTATVKGPLVVETVTALLKQMPECSAEISEIQMTDITELDSAGLALLVFWQSQIKHKGGEVVFRDVPPRAATLMQISGLEHLVDNS